VITAKDFCFVGAPAWKTVDREVTVKVNRWVKRFQELAPGEAFAVFEPKAARLVMDYAIVNQIPHTVQRFKGGGWGIGRA
jgi:hypothetical protein